MFVVLCVTCKHGRRASTINLHNATINRHNAHLTVTLAHALSLCAHIAASCRSSCRFTHHRNNVARCHHGVAASLSLDADCQFLLSWLIVACPRCLGNDLLPVTHVYSTEFSWRSPNGAPSDYVFVSGVVVEPGAGSTLSRGPTKRWLCNETLILALNRTLRPSSASRTVATRRSRCTPMAVGRFVFQHEEAIGNTIESGDLEQTVVRLALATNEQCNKSCASD